MAYVPPSLRKATPVATPASGITLAPVPMASLTAPSNTPKTSASYVPPSLRTATAVTKGNPQVPLDLESATAFPGFSATSVTSVVATYEPKATLNFKKAALTVEEEIVYHEPVTVLATHPCTRLRVVEMSDQDFRQSLNRRLTDGMKPHTSASWSRVYVPRVNVHYSPEYYDFEEESLPSLEEEDTWTPEDAAEAFLEEVDAAEEEAEQSYI